MYFAHCLFTDNLYSALTCQMRLQNVKFTSTAVMLKYLEISIGK